MQSFKFNASIAGVVLLLGAPAYLLADVSLSITFGPPPIPLYDQPPCPADGYLWTPGYWAWADNDYFWVPGTWVLAPAVGLLWTPGYWGWEQGRYAFHDGYWGPNVGFYGGVNYGNGYGGSGFDGGRWQGQKYSYNRAVTNVGPTNSANSYSRRASVRNTSRVAYNGGKGGLRSVPTRSERVVQTQHHQAPTAEQTQHVQSAHQNQELRASANRGRPPVAATRKSGDFSPKSVVPARGAGGPGPRSNATKNSIPSQRTQAPEASPQRPSSRPTARVTEPPPTHPAPPRLRTEAPPMPKPQVAPARPMVQERRSAPETQRSAPPAAQHAPANGGRPEAQRPQAAPRPAPEARPRPEPQRENEEQRKH